MAGGRMWGWPLAHLPLHTARAQQEAMGLSGQRGAASQVASKPIGRALKPKPSTHSCTQTPTLPRHRRHSPPAPRQSRAQTRPPRPGAAAGLPGPLGQPLGSTRRCWRRCCPAAPPACPPAWPGMRAWGASRPPTPAHVESGREPQRRRPGGPDPARPGARWCCGGCAPRPSAAAAGAGAARRWMRPRPWRQRPGLPPGQRATNRLPGWRCEGWWMRELAAGWRTGLRWRGSGLQTCLAAGFRCAPRRWCLLFRRRCLPAPPCAAAAPASATAGAGLRRRGAPRRSEGRPGPCCRLRAPGGWWAGPGARPAAAAAPSKPTR